MKKVLSVLLILAGLFGFYGGTVTLQDASSAKSYWEDKGETALNNLDKLDDGMDQLSENKQTYLDGLDQLAQGEADFAAAPGKLAAGRKQLAEGKKSLADLETLITSIKAVKGKMPTYNDGVKQVKDGMKELEAAMKDQDNVKKLKLLGLFMDKAGAAALNADIKNIAENTESMSIEEFVPAAESLAGHVKTARANALKLADGVDKIADELKEYIDSLRKGKIEVGGITKMLMRNQDTLKDSITMVVNAVTRKQIVDLLSQMTEGDKSEEDIVCLGDKLVSLIKGVSETLKSSVDGDDVRKLLNGVSALEEGIPLLKDGQNGNPKAKTQAEQLGLAGALKAIYGGILDSKDVLVPAIKAKDPTAISKMKKFIAKTSVDMPIEDFHKLVNDAVNMNSKLLPGFKKAYKDGAATLAAGKIELAQGEADFAAAPAKLADGRKQLAVYEDGVKQVRDGFDTLMNEKGEGGVTSIADRVGPGEDFSLKDGSLDFNTGYAATTHGREYVDELSGVVTKELMGRIIGFGIGIFGGVLAIVAAFLGLRKKYKGAGVCGLLAAVAAAAGAFVANNAGMELSEIAGSTVGKTPLITLAVLGVVALVAAIAYLTAPKAE